MIMTKKISNSSPSFLPRSRLIPVELLKIKTLLVVYVCVFAVALQQSATQESQNDPLEHVLTLKGKDEGKHEDNNESIKS